MFTPRRLYIYAVSAISLNAVTWALISLLRDLLISGFRASVTNLAFQTAVILIGLPVFLIHWLWSQRLANNEDEERGATIRRIYLYGIQALCLIPIIDSTFAVLSTLLLIPAGGSARYFYPKLSSGETILYYLIAIILLSILWYYHYRVNREDARIIPETGSAAVARRFFVLGFSGAGLSMTVMATVFLLRWVMFQIGTNASESITFGFGPIYEVARLIIGLPVWLLFWRWAQNLFFGTNDEERESALRKFYLYLVIFISALSTVTAITFILEGLFRRILGVPALGGSEGDVREALSIIVVMVVVWVFHYFVLRDDAKRVEDVPRQQGIQRLYLYLIAAIGLTAFIAGISGDLSVLIRSLDKGVFGEGLQRELSWFAAVTLAGMPVWFIPWRQAQKRSDLPGTEGVWERRSVLRKIYLYFFIFIAAMTLMSGLIYIVFTIISTIFGAPSLKLSEIGQTLAFSFIAIGVLLYHGYALRQDQRLSMEDQTDRFDGLSVAIVDFKNEFVDSVSAAINKATPGLTIHPIILSRTLDEQETDLESQGAITQIQQATIVVGPWVIAVPNWGDGIVTEGIAQAVRASSGHKILLPIWKEKWSWAGIERPKPDMLERHIARAIGQTLEGEEIRLVKPLGVGAIIGIILAVIVLLSLMSIPVIFLLSF